MKLSRRAPVLVAAVAVVVTAAATTAPVEAAWRPPRTVGRAAEVTAAVQASDRVGGTALVWVAVDDQGASHLYYDRVRPDGTRAPRLELQDTGHSPVQPDVGVDDDGDAVVVWATFDEGLEHWICYARRVSRSGVLGPVVRISRPDEDSTKPVVAVAPRGNAVTVTQIKATTYANTAIHRFSTSNRVVPRKILLGAAHHQVEVSRTGWFVIGAGRAFIRPKYQVGRFSPTGEWDARSVSGGRPFTQGRMAVSVDPRGTMLILLAATEPVRRLWVVRWRTDHSVTAARKVVPDALVGGHPWIVTDAQGDSVLAWADDTTGRHQARLRARTLGPTGALGTIRSLGEISGPEMLEEPGRFESTLQVASDDDGDTVLQWWRWSAGDQPLSRVARIGRGGKVLGAAGWAGQPVALSTSPTGRTWLGQLPDPATYVIRGGP